MKKRARVRKSKVTSKQLTVTSLTLVVACMLGILIAANRPSVTDTMTFAEAQQQIRQQQSLPSCMELASQDIPSDARAAITSVVAAKLTEVPAAVAYSVFFKTYDQQKATGTIAYDGIGNTFNFVVEHTGDKTKNNGWKLADFQACEVKSRNV